MCLEIEEYKFPGGVGDLVIFSVKIDWPNKIGNFQWSPWPHPFISSASMWVFFSKMIQSPDSQVPSELYD